MALDMFLLLDGIEGESVDRDHVRQLDVLSYSFGVSNSGSPASGGAGAGRSSFSDLNVVTYQTGATIALLQRACTGAVVRSALLSVRRAGPESAGDHYRVLLTGCVVTAVNEASSGGDDRTLTSFSLAYAEVEWSYRRQDDRGVFLPFVKTAWNVAENTRA